MTDSEEEDIYEQVNTFPYIVTKLPKELLFHCYFKIIFMFIPGSKSNNLRVQNPLERPDLSPVDPSLALLLSLRLLCPLEEKLSDARRSFLF